MIILQREKLDTHNIFSDIHLVLDRYVSGSNRKCHWTDLLFAHVDNTLNEGSQLLQDIPFLWIQRSLQMG